MPDVYCHVCLRERFRHEVDGPWFVTLWIFVFALTVLGGSLWINLR